MQTPQGPGIQPLAPPDLCPGARRSQRHRAARRSDDNSLTWLPLTPRPHSGRSAKGETLLARSPRSRGARRGCISWKMQGEMSAENPFSTAPVLPLWLPTLPDQSPFQQPKSFLFCTGPGRSSLADDFAHWSLTGVPSNSSQVLSMPSLQTRLTQSLPARLHLSQGDQRARV